MTTHSSLGPFLQVMRGKWQFGACFATALLYTMVSIADWTADRKLLAATSAMAHSGGGVLAVVSPMDCYELSDVLAEVADGLLAHGVPFESLVIADNLADESGFIARRNQMWPHRAIPLRSVYDLVSKTGTPIVMAVTSEKRVALIEHITGRNAALISRLAEVVL